MHDQSLEQKLRAVLQAEGDRLPFTITSAELERRHALRRRGGLSPMASLGLAAAVGIGLVGMVGVAGGWFDQRTAVVPPSASPAPSEAPSERTARDTLPSLDELIGSRDPATIVRAQSFGPERAPDVAPTADLHSVIFAPVTATGPYAVEIACLGSIDLQLQIVNRDPAVPGTSAAITCDGSGTGRPVDLVAGDALAIKTSGSPSWRIVVSGPPVAFASAIPEEITVHTGDETLLDRTSVGNGSPPEPDQTTGLYTWPLDGVPVRAGYRVVLACAGPVPIRYRIGGIDPGPAPDATTVTQVACDGAAHQDWLDLATPTGTDVAIVADPRDSWRILVTADGSPIALPEDGGGWGMSSALGPSYFNDGGPVGISIVGGDGPVRVVISCAGATTVTGTIEIGVPVGSRRPDPFTIDCYAGSSGATLERVYQRGANQVSIVTDPVGTTIWLAVTAQVRLPASPAP